MQEKNTHPNQNSYLYDSMNTRVPPINISGKKLPNSRTKFETPSPLSHSKSYQHFPNPNIYLREESPQRMMLSPPNHLIREISHPIMPKYYENERILVTPPPIIKSIRPVAYRPALINLNNRIPNYNMNLNPFEVVEQLFFEENSTIIYLYKRLKKF